MNCPNCDVADSVLAAYRHALKDIIRGEESEAKTRALKAIDNDQMMYLGQLFHKIVKAAVLIDKHMTDQESVDFKTSAVALHEAVVRIGQDPGATVRGWMGGR